MQAGIGGDGRFVRETGLAGEVAGLVGPVITDLGFRLVRVVASGRDGGTLQIMAERDDGELTIDECARISRELVPVLDAYGENIRERYSLEVSSPGIDRPLVRAADFERSIGREAKLELIGMVDGRKRFRGRIDGFADGKLRLEVDLEDGRGVRFLGIGVEQIASAKLVMNERLMREALHRQGGPQDD